MTETGLKEKQSAAGQSAHFFHRNFTLLVSALFQSTTGARTVNEAG
jgi:hypothetical protein